MQPPSVDIAPIGTTGSLTKPIAPLGKGSHEDCLVHKDDIVLFLLRLTSTTVPVEQIYRHSFSVFAGANEDSINPFLLR